MDIDAALDRLIEALAVEGVEGPDPPESPASLEQLEAEIAPMLLPAEVRRFWERFDP